jgi:protein kinase A
VTETVRRARRPDRSREKINLVSLYRNGKCPFLALFFPNLPRCHHLHLSPLVMIRRMTDKLGHLAHGHQKTLQHQQQTVPGLPLPVTTHTHLEHRGSISTQRTSESSKRGESVDETRPIDECNFPYQRRAKGTYRLADFLFQRTLGTGSFGRVHLGRPAFWPLLSCSLLTVRSKHNLRFYAIKVLQKEKIVKSKQIDHTNNEQQMLLAVQNPFIINLWGSFQDATNLYMVMDFVPGGELFTLLRRSNVRFPTFDAITP